MTNTFKAGEMTCEYLAIERNRLNCHHKQQAETDRHVFWPREDHLRIVGVRFYRYNSWKRVVDLIFNPGMPGEDFEKI